MRADFAKDPGRLVLALEDALTTSEVCACPIVRTAVDLAGRDPALTSQILIAAIRLMPAAAAVLTDCVLLEAPSTAPAIRTALAKELGENAPELLAQAKNITAESVPTGAEPPSVTLVDGAGKNPVAVAVPEPATTESEPENLFPSVGVSGIYITATLRRASVGSLAHGGVAQAQKVVSAVKKTLRRPVAAVTAAAPE